MKAILLSPCTLQSCYTTPHTSPGLFCAVVYIHSIAHPVYPLSMRYGRLVGPSLAIHLAPCSGTWKPAPAAENDTHAVVPLAIVLVVPRLDHTGAN